MFHFYRFKAEWLRQEYVDEGKVHQDDDLSQEVKLALLGIHQRSKGNFKIQPSSLDFEFLEAFYSDSSIGMNASTLNVEVLAHFHQLLFLSDCDSHDSYSHGTRICM